MHFDISQLSHPKNIIKDPLVAWDMMASLPCESTPKILPDDTHMIYYQKRQWDMVASLPCESTQKMLSNDTHIVLLPKKAMGDDGIMNTQKMLPNDTHITYFQKRQLLMMPSDAPVTL